MEKRVLFKSMAVAALALPMVLVSCKEDKKSSSSKSIAVDSVALNIHDTTIFVGDNVQFSYTIFPNDATNKDVEWSGDEDILIISNSGQVAGKAAGTGYVFITTVSGEHKDSCKVNVIKNIEFSDKAFESILVANSNINKDGDDGISLSEAQAVTSLDVSGKKLSSVAGIEYFTNLEELVCSNNQLTEIDLSKLPKLKKINCKGNQLSKLDLSNNSNLTFVFCEGNNLDTLDIRANQNLETLFCGNQNNGKMKLVLSIDQFNTVWKENGEDDSNAEIELVMNIFENAVFHSGDFKNDWKNGDSISYNFKKEQFSFRLYGNDGNELSFYDPSILKQIVWASSNENVATIVADYETGESNTAQMTVKLSSTGNTIISGTINNEYTISFNLEAK